MSAYSIIMTQIYTYHKFHIKNNRAARHAALLFGISSSQHLSPAAPDLGQSSTGSMRKDSILLDSVRNKFEQLQLVHLEI